MVSNRPPAPATLRPNIIAASTRSTVMITWASWTTMIWLASRQASITRKNTLQPNRGRTRSQVEQQTFFVKMECGLLLLVAAVARLTSFLPPSGGLTDGR